MLKQNPIYRDQTGTDQQQGQTLVSDEKIVFNEAHNTED